MPVRRDSGLRLLASQQRACFSETAHLRGKLLRASFPGRHGDLGSGCREQGREGQMRPRCFCLVREMQLAGGEMVLHLAERVVVWI